jgi:protein SCO1
MRAALLALALLAAGGARAHDGHAHAPAPAAATPRAAPFPVEIRARFDLIDQTGRRRTEADFAGRTAMVFFGYASCDALCSVALPRMAEALDLLGPVGAAVDAVLITVDPERDAPAAMGAALAAIHPRLIGLTGSPAALAAARAAFGAEAKPVLVAPDGGTIYAHASLVYVVGPDGLVVSALPPVLSPERMAEIVASRLCAGGAGCAETFESR